jgi:argininosuccinate lyase
MAFRRAHEVVGALVRRLVAERRDFADLSMDEWRGASPLFAEDVCDAVTAHASVSSRKTPQSTHPEAVANALSALRAWLRAAQV